jgi:hypothetical protein
MSDNENRQLVQIQINRQSYESPNPTTGHALYKLGDIGGAHNELFREDEGAERDVLVPDDDTVTHLRPQEHFYSQRDWKVIVNGKRKTVTDHTLTYAQVVALDPLPDATDKTLYTVTYENGPKKNPEGDLLPGHKVRVKDGMIFHVEPTNQS